MTLRSLSFVTLCAVMSGCYQTSDASSELYQSCSLGVLEGLDNFEFESGDFIIEAENSDCSTNICGVYGDRDAVFCTHACETDADCINVGRGVCEVEVTVSEDPNLLGRYCVPEVFSEQ